MKIGIAIPCYSGHINSLFGLLDSIQNQSRIPDKVVVSSSSTKTSDFDLHSEKLKKYTFPLQIIISEEKKNAAQNRNIAAFRMMDMDYISFIDADDIMHPQRTEILMQVFNEHNSDIILHNYFIDIPFEKELFGKIDNNEIIVRTNSLRQHWSGCIEHVTPSINEGIHHSQVSIKKDVFYKVIFPEEVEFNRKEDCIFCHRVFSLPNIQNAYIANQLSFYAPSGTIF